MAVSPKEFGNELKKLRNEKKMTLTELGDKVELTQAYLSMLENGKKGKVKPDTIRKLSEGLGVSYMLLMNKAGYLNQKEETPKNFGTYIKELRQAANKSIEEVSKESGLSVGHLQRIENNDTVEPSKKQLQKLGEALGIDDLYMWFFENTNYHLYGGDVFDQMFKYSEQEAKFTLSVPPTIDIPVGGGGYITKATRAHHLKDVFYYLLMDDERYYKDKLLTNSDKEKILTMLQTLFE